MQYDDVQLKDNKNFQRFELWVDGKMAKLEYELQHSRIALIHTEVPKELEGKGVAAAIVAKALQYIETKGMKIVPLCPYVIDYIKKHPEWERLLEHGIHIRK
jgi:uncharacterized protein